MSRIKSLLLASSLTVLALPGMSRAQPSEDLSSDVREDTSSSRALYERGGLAGLGLSAGAKLGAGFSQPFGDLGSTISVELEVSYLLPVLDRSLSVFAAGGYTQPKAEGSGLEDARLPGKAEYTLTQQTATITLGAMYRLHLAMPMLRPYAAFGPRLFLMRTNIKGSAGSQPFGDNHETATRIGIFGALGAELHFGPGAALIELSATWASIDNYVLRDTNVAALGVSVGYRVFL